MPELPEVEAARRLVHHECIGKRIIKVIAAEDDKVFCGVSSNDVSTALLNRQIKSANRKGKHLWIDFDDDGPSLLLHFGMTGGIAIRDKGGAHYKRYSIDDGSSGQWPPKFCKLELHFDGGSDEIQLAFCDSRRFARVRLQKEPLNNPPISELGPDPLLSTWFTEDEFLKAAAKQKRAIKAVLLDQSFISGVGNWVGDEILYQCRIHPEQPACSLPLDQLKTVYTAIQSICRQASDVDANSELFPSDWLFHHRWSKGAREKPKIGGHSIEHITVGGRTSAFVPALQKLNKEKKKKREAGNADDGDGLRVVEAKDIKSQSSSRKQKQPVAKRSKTDFEITTAGIQRNSAAPRGPVKPQVEASRQRPKAAAVSTAKRITRAAAITHHVAKF